MKILIMDWPGFGIETVKKLLPQMGIETEEFEFSFDSGQIRNGEELGVKIAERILSSKADAVFSFNYFPVVATAVHACRKKYLSWVYDSPAVLLYSMSVFFPENYIFHFDSSEVQRMRSEGVEHVFYLPLAANTGDYDRIEPADAQHEKYDADVAMIGSMYSEERYQIFKKYTDFDEFTKGYLDGLMKAQEGLYGVDVITPSLNEDIMKRILKVVPLAKESGDGYETPGWIFAEYFLAKQLTARDRTGMLDAMSHRYDTAVYTLEPTPFLEKVQNRGRLEYYTEAPVAIKCAKINLNISLRSIHTGIPLRAMDIMACGGFLLSNYQADMAEDFIPGEDFVYYESIEDAVEKAGYYLAHEEERAAIAHSGYMKVKEQHGFKLKIEQMLSAAGVGIPD